MSTRASLLNAVTAVCHQLAAAGFVAATDGNVSARRSASSVVITPSGVNKGRLTMKDLVTVRMDGTRIGGGRKPSTELDMHLFIYGQRPDVSAIVHAHPPFATAFAAARIPMTDAVFPEVIVGIGAIPLADYATPSTREVRESLTPFVDVCNAVLLANHGVVTLGASLDEAMFRMGKVEHLAHILTIARSLGGARRLTRSQLRRLQEASKANYGKDIESLPFLETDVW
jgi:L-fuculose-phosphate aldolase